MKFKRQIIAGAVAQLAGRGVQFIIGLLLIPLMYRYLTAEEVGLWFLIAQSTLLLSLLDFGLGPTFTRKIALSIGAADRDDQQTDAEELARIVGTGRWLYRFNAQFVLLVTAVAGWPLIASLDLQVLTPLEAARVWGLACFNYTVGSLVAYRTCLLMGCGHVGAATHLATTCRLIALVFKAVAIVAGGRLSSIIAIDCLASLLLLGAMSWLLQRREGSAGRFAGAVWSGEIFTQLRPLAVRSWLTTLGAFLILRTDQYFIAIGLGPESLPDYQSALLLMTNLHQMALIATASSSVFYSQLWAAADVAAVHDLVRRNADLAMAVMITGSATMLLIAEPLFGWWLGPGHFVGYPILIVFIITLILETQHVVYAYASIATDDEAFAWTAMGSGILNLILTALLLRPLGLLGVAAATMFSQMLTNNWYVIYRSHRRLGMSLSSYWSGTVLPLGGLTIALAIPLIALWYPAGLAADSVLRPLAGVMISGLMMTAFLAWRLRRRIRLPS